MKKLMFAALAVAGMSAVAADKAEFKPVVAEKLTISVKTVDPTVTKVATTKINGFVFTDKDGKQQVYTWTKALNTNEPDGLTYEWTAGDGKTKIKTKAGKLYDLTTLGRELKYGCRFDEIKGGKKQGKAIVFQDASSDATGRSTFMHWAGYGSGSAQYTTLSTPHKDSIVGAKESISGNIVKFADNGGFYGTWKMSLDKSTTKNLTEKGWTIKDVLGKNKVEFWDTNR